MPVRLTVALLLASTPVLATPAASSPYGVWLRGDGNARVRIAPCGDDICATNLWIRDTSKGENVGDRLVLTVRKTRTGALAGTAYDPQRDRTYSMEMTVEGKALRTRGCILGGLLCRSVSWSREN